MSRTSRSQKGELPFHLIFFPRYSAFQPDLEFNYLLQNLFVYKYKVACYTLLAPLITM